MSLLKRKEHDILRIFIHAVPERIANVCAIKKKLISQGIMASDIFIYEDTTHEGNLPAYIKSIDYISRFVLEKNELIWHLQDDVVLSDKFYVNIRHFGSYCSGYDIYCGFSSEVDYKKNAAGEKVYFRSGEVPCDEMWYSFPCIGIPLWVSNRFIIWLTSKNEYHDDETKAWISAKKFDDSLFRKFIFEKLGSTVHIENIAPNLVDHRDDLCGGSIVNEAASSMNRMARFWNG